jgi:glycerol kinase
VINKNDKYIIALDQGTTNSKAIIINQKGQLIHQSVIKTKVLLLENGYIEQDPFKLIKTQILTFKKVLSESKINLSQIVGIGLTNQRETTII